jgi:hypothetical protein
MARSNIDVAEAYGIAADGRTDNALALMRMRRDLIGSDRHWELRFPPGEVLASDNRWLSGVRRFTVVGGPTTFRSIYTGDDEIFHRPIWPGDIFQGNTLIYRGRKSDAPGSPIHSAPASAQQIRLLSADHARRFSAGDRILLFSYDQTGLNYPPGARYYEWHTVTAAEGATLSLEHALRYDYPTDIWPLAYGDEGDSLTVPAIINLDRPDYVYCAYAEFHDVVWGDSTGGVGGNVQFPAGELHFTGSSRSESGYFWPTENRLATFTGLRHRGGSEVDQLNGTVGLADCDFAGGLVGPTGTERLLLEDCTFGDKLVINPRELEIRNTLIRAGDRPDTFYPSLASHPSGNPVRRVVLDRITFAGGATSAHEHHIDLGGWQHYQIERVDGSDIEIPFRGRLHPLATKIPYTAEAGRTRIVEEHGTKGGLITEISFDPSRNGGRGAYLVRGDWDPPCPGETWYWSSFREIIDRGGHRVADGRPLWSPDCLRWSGNTAPAGETHTMTIDSRSLRSDGKEMVIPFYADLLSLEARVTSAGSGTLTLSGDGGGKLLSVPLSRPGLYTPTGIGGWQPRLYLHVRGGGRAVELPTVEIRANWRER